MLGAWLATSPFVFGSFEQASFSDAVWRVTAERQLWEPALRSTLTAWSDLCNGLLIMAFGILSLSRRLAWAQWANTAVGPWLLFAPLVFWSPSAAVYANDTLAWTSWWPWGSSSSRAEDGANPSGGRSSWAVPTRTAAGTSSPALGRP